MFKYECCEADSEEDTFRNKNTNDDNNNHSRVLTLFFSTSRELVGSFFTQFYFGKIGKTSEKLKKRFHN